MNPEEYKELDFCECDDQGDGCSTVNYQYANISTPIEIRPNVRTGEITIECCEEPFIECCDCDRENGLDIVVTQKVCIKIPVKYQIEACVGEESITCE